MAGTLGAPQSVSGAHIVLMPDESMKLAVPNLTTGLDAAIPLVSSFISPIRDVARVWCREVASATSLTLFESVKRNKWVRQGSG
jgi:hypothetical protein